MQFKPLYDRIIIAPDPEKDQTDSGLFLAGSLGPTQSGTIVAMGDGIYDSGVLIPMRVKIGDRVLFTRAATTARQITIEGGQYLLMRENELYGIL